MKQLPVILLLLLACLGVSAQTRSYSDNASNSFIFGLENYYYGVSGSLDFQLEGTLLQASVSGGDVHVNGVLVSAGSGETIIGIHDFTGDHDPELVVARRTDKGVSAAIYSYAGGRWKELGHMCAPDSRDIRVFRQVLSIRSGEVLYSWTWHSPRFDFKSSDGSPEPTSL